jgi:hypothetical protein
LVVRCVCHFRHERVSHYYTCRRFEATTRRSFPRYPPREIIVETKALTIKLPADPAGQLQEGQGSQALPQHREPPQEPDQRQSPRAWPTRYPAPTTPPRIVHPYW